MTDTPATPPAPESPRPVAAGPASGRLDASDAPWPLRPWIMAAIGAAAGLVFYLLVDRNYDAPHEPWRDALAAFVAVSTVVFVLGVELRRWHWAAGFALLWGAVIGLITWHSAGYNVGGSPVEWPFWSGILAVLVATPMFQTRRDVAPDWRFWKLWDMPYARLHGHAWTDAVLGAAGLAFTGVSFLLVVLIAEMFHLIGIDLIRDLLNDEWFGWMLAGAAFGGAVGLLRERDKLVSTLQRLVMIVLAVLAPVLAVALVIFLLSLLGTGLGKLWDSGFSTAALMLAAAAFAVLLANAVIGNGDDDKSANRALQSAAAVLAVAVLPLAVIAAMSMQVRIGEYGWTPERIWGVIAVGVALAYGAAGLWAAVRGRRGFDELLRPLQQRLAIGLMLLAAFLALPIVDFGAISTRDQVARLKSGAVAAETFDWAALAFDFGPSGRKALKDLTKSVDKVRAAKARIALAGKNRWDLSVEAKLTATDVDFLEKPIEAKIRVLPADRPLPPQFLALASDQNWCRTMPCVAQWIAEDRIILLSARDDYRAVMVTKKADGEDWEANYTWSIRDSASAEPTIAELEAGRVEIRTVNRRQLFLNGKPVGDVFE